MADAGLGDAQQQPGLAGDLPQLVQQLVLDLSLGFGADVVHQLQQDVDQRVGQLAAAQPAEHRQ